MILLRNTNLKKHSSNVNYNVKLIDCFQRTTSLKKNQLKDPNLGLFTPKCGSWTCCHVYLQGASLHHDLLSVWLNSCQGEELSLEHHRRFLRVQFDRIKLLFAPFHIHWLWGGNTQGVRATVSKH